MLTHQLILWVPVVNAVRREQVRGDQHLTEPDGHTRRQVRGADQGNNYNGLSADSPHLSFQPIIA